jgi:hypothetical protein
MAIKESTRVWETSKQEETSLLILLAIADSANEQGHAFPGREHLAKYARCDIATVSRLTTRIEADDELYVKRRPGRGNHYMVLAGLPDEQKQARRAMLDALFPVPVGSDQTSLPTKGGSGDLGTTGTGDQDITTGRSEVVPGGDPDPLIEPSVDPLMEFDSEIQRIWDTAHNELQLQISREAFDSWLRHARLVGYEEGRYTIGVLNIYAREWLEHRLKTVVVRTLSYTAGEPVEVEFVVWNPSSEEMKS